MSRSRALQLLSLAFVPCALLVLPACGGDDPASPPAPLSSKTEIELLDAGKEPRQQLRYRFELGREERGHIDMQMAMSMEQEGRELPSVKIPTMRMPMRWRTKELLPDGEILLEFSVEGFEILETEGVDPRVQKQLGTRLKDLGALKGEMKVSAQGQNEVLQLHVPESLPAEFRQTLDALKQQMKSLTTTLPVEPVGVGASWLVRSTIVTPSMRLRQEARFELQALTEQGMEATFSLRQTAPKQKMHLPNVPAGIDVTLESMGGEGSGKLKVAFDRLVPRSEIELSTEAQSRADHEGRSSRTRVKMDVKVDIRPQD